MKKIEILGMLGGMAVFFMLLTIFDMNSLTDKGVFANIFMTVGWGCFMMLCRSLLKRRIDKSKSNETPSHNGAK